MVRKMVALLVSGAVWLGGMNAALAQAASPQPVPSVSTTQDAKADRNSTPLPPGGAAGIRQAQGTSGETIWTIIGIGFFGGVVLAMILVGNDEGDGSMTTTTSN